MEKTKSKKGIDRFTLKLIACISMLIDHASIILYKNGYLLSKGINIELADYTNTYFIIYLVFRWIGRIAFPIYAFFIAEGYTHTKNKWKYFGRLCAFAIISEIPFDIAFGKSAFDIKTQNVFFTLALGLLAIIALDKITSSQAKVPKWIKNIVATICVILIAIFANIIYSDYGETGVIVIVLFYVLRNTKTLKNILAVILLTIKSISEIFTIFDLPLLNNYNGERGINNKIVKYGFYIFYPLHLLLLYILKIAIW